MEPRSLMEQKALMWEGREKSDPFQFLPSSKEDTEMEIFVVNDCMKGLSAEMRYIRKELANVERRFLLLSKYKLALEKQITPIKLVVKEKKKKKLSKKELLLKKIEALSPAQKKAFEEMD